MDIKDKKWEYAIWQPELRIAPKVGLTIQLNPEFAREALNMKPTEHQVNLLSRVMKEGHREELKHTPPNLYDLAEDSCYLKCIYLDGGKGTWLNSDAGTSEMIPKDNKAINYSCHNVDSVQEAVHLQILFDHWVFWVHHHMTHYPNNE